MNDKMQIAVEARMRAAEARAAKLATDEPPNGFQRRVNTGWLGRRDIRTNAIATMPTRLRAEKTEKDGKQWYVVEGYATVYERGYEMWDMFGEYTEVVSAGAAEQTIEANPDVVFLVNHQGLAMARTVAGTLELRSDQVGLFDRAWLNPQRQDVKDLILGIDDGTITEQSFAFRIVSGQWSPDYAEYRINVFDINRGDTSAVNYGANPHTSIAARAREVFGDLDKLPVGMALAMRDRLNGRTDLDEMPARLSERAAEIAAAEAIDTSLTGRSVSAVDAWLASVQVR